VNLFSPEPHPTAIERPIRRATVTSRTAREAFFVGAVAIVVGLTALLIQRIVSDDGSMVVARPRAAAAYGLAFRSIDVDPSLAAGAGEHVFYAGSWQHVRGIFDGRDRGTSSRSFRIGSELSFTFHGERFEIFGIRGPHGGYASAIVDGSPVGTMSFAAKQKTVGARVFASRPLAEGAHWVQIFVVAAPDGSGKRGFVNIDRVAFGSRYVIR
jgi:hypothetical protein